MRHIEAIHRLPVPATSSVEFQTVSQSSVNSSSDFHQYSTGVPHHGVGCTGVRYWSTYQKIYYGSITTATYHTIHGTSTDPDGLSNANPNPSCILFHIWIRRTW